jgi:1,4-alpha-glucan branching enzyme
MTKKITFTLPPQIVDNATSALLLGDFNNWDINSGSQMVAQKDGSLKTTINLEAGKTYQYRFLLNTGAWVNDENAGEFVHEYQVQNCVITVPEKKVVVKKTVVNKEIIATPKKASTKTTKVAKIATGEVITEKKVATKKAATAKKK